MKNILDTWELIADLLEEEILEIIFEAGKYDKLQQVVKEATDEAYNQGVKNEKDRIIKEIEGIKRHEHGDKTNEHRAYNQALQDIINKINE